MRKDLKKYGGVKPPREFVLVDRAAIGLGSVFMHLNAELNWHEKFEILINNFNEKKVTSSQKTVIAINKNGHVFCYSNRVSSMAWTYL